MTDPVDVPDPLDPAVPIAPAPSLDPVADPHTGSHVPAGAREIAAALCPYLASEGGSWRMATPSRDHRCIALSPPTAQTTDKQRRHCLSAQHVDCSIYRARVSRAA